MYEYMCGTLVSVKPLYIVLDVQGIGYQIQVANPFRFTSLLDQEVMVYIHQAVREDAITLYGFKEEYEKQLYLKLISVSGIGPKSGLSILANEDHTGLVQAIETEHVTYLTKFPGVGKKTASQIILDLKGKLDDVLVEVGQLPIIPVEETTLNKQHLSEAMEALVGLGYSAREVNKIKPKLEEADAKDTEELLRMAFKLLLKN
ncbi:Holliday junction branch migration protein RuvA [Jeotgalibaca sp. PTS2502]|jgi:holliday junction DNA helicase RuvA|uniref:Holliday junction branch migration complex subunit RuvA n=1 Tax=Candidatus Jeotgalibaca merdavium TaxID=2838627 RepID=A0A9D2I0L3_9LACT|nr:Holliday junction branch migration protein RuvA [Jeotgalibaca sp. PTS2502]APZ48887.1 Holliday junction branch migration protein RuvA [Jeotgalibaca sp. PTS2502]HJA89388.1 Holliday junction branch migration protein RuvA [Candidatus Jeotgalibaca merdavium]